MVNNLLTKLLLIVVIIILTISLGYLWFTVFIPHLQIGSRIIRIIIGLVGLILLYFLIKYAYNKFRKFL